MITMTQIVATYFEVERLREENERLRERIANENALAWYGWPLGEPLDERQTVACYAHADSILALITTPQADPCADVRHKTLEEIELWAAEVSSITDPASGEDFNRGREDALTEAARHCRALITKQPSGIFRTLTPEQ